MQWVIKLTDNSWLSITDKDRDKILQRDADAGKYVLLDSGVYINTDRILWMEKQPA